MGKLEKKDLLCVLVISIWILFFYFSKPCIHALWFSVYSSEIFVDFEPCISILWLSIYEARGWHRPHEYPTGPICLEILPCLQRLEESIQTTLGNHFHFKEVFVLCGEDIWFLLIKNKTHKKKHYQSLNSFGKKP